MMVLLVREAVGIPEMIAEVAGLKGIIMMILLVALPVVAVLVAVPSQTPMNTQVLQTTPIQTYGVSQALQTTPMKT